MTGQDNHEAIQALAKAYANELDAQLGALKHFTRHSGENGRVHEHFMKTVIRRWLPPDTMIGTGFIALPKWTSTQMDILECRT